jgi:hypothetical protein
MQPTSQPSIMPSTALQTKIVYSCVSSLEMTAQFDDDAKNAYVKALKTTIPDLSSNDEIKINEIIDLANVGNQTQKSMVRSMKTLDAVHMYEIHWVLAIASSSFDPDPKFTAILGAALNNTAALATALQNQGSSAFVGVYISNVHFLFQLIFA